MLKCPARAGKIGRRVLYLSYLVRKLGVCSPASEARSIFLFNFLPGNGIKALILSI